MERTDRQKKKSGVGILRAVRSGVFGALLALVLGIVGGLECGVMPIEIGVASLVFCGIGLVVCGGTR